MPTARDVKDALKQLASPDAAAKAERFHKTGKGEYAEGDKFIGVSVPSQRKIAKEYHDLSLAQLKQILRDPIHECRQTAILILVDQYQRAKEEKATQAEIVEFYLANLNYVNNWDLVDSSAHKILGDWLLDREDEQHILDELAESNHLWRERVSVIACFPFIRRYEFEWILRLSEWFLDHEHDLMHKAVGWMLREAGKRDKSFLLSFLEAHAATMPRTMLRYSIEKLPQSQRQDYLSRKG